MVLCLKVRNKIMRGRVLRSFVPVNVVCLGNLHICASPSSNVSSSLYYLKLTPPPPPGAQFLQMTDMFLICVSVCPVADKFLLADIIAHIPVPRSILQFRKLLLSLCATVYIPFYCNSFLRTTGSVTYMEGQTLGTNCPSPPCFSVKDMDELHLSPSVLISQVFRFPYGGIICSILLFI
jgi:hypothetical protein